MGIILFSVKFWATVCLFSLLFWIVDRFIPTMENFYNVLFGLPDPRSGVAFWFLAANFGLIARFAGVILLLIALILIWSRKKNFIVIKNFFVLVIILEITYFILLIPSSYGLLTYFSARNFLSAPYLGVAYLLQVIFTVPLLTILAIKIRSYDKTPKELCKWIGMVCVGYVAALWINSVSMMV